MCDKIQILCYGDSNTWGTVGRWEESDVPSQRYDPAHRWPCVLQEELGDGFQVIPEGLGGRTTIYSPPGEAWKNGETYLKPCLHSHRPLDLVIIMLGTNDLQICKEMDSEKLPVGISRLADMVLENRRVGRDGAPELLIIAPVEVRPSDPKGRVLVYPKFRCEIGRALSLEFPRVYEQVARDKNCYFLNAQEFAQPGPADGVHFDPESQVRLGRGVAEYIRTHIFPGR